MRFVDTNVLLYAISRDPKEIAKRDLANQLLGHHDLALSAQVLQEFYAQATRPTCDGSLSHGQAVDLVVAFTRFAFQPTTIDLVHAAMDARDRFNLSYWDAAIIEAARMLSCTTVLSEDLSHGQSYDGIVVVDPFR